MQADAQDSKKSWEASQIIKEEQADLFDGKGVLLNKIKGIFARHSDAAVFIWEYTKYVHMIDDIIDGDLPVDCILHLQTKAREIFTNPFYLRHHAALSMVECLVNNDYADSVSWEKSNVTWQVQHADVLRHSGYHMFFAVIALISDYDTLRSISLAFRAHSHEMHLCDILCHL